MMIGKPRLAIAAAFAFLIAGGVTWLFSAPVEPDQTAAPLAVQVAAFASEDDEGYRSSPIEALAELPAATAEQIGGVTLSRQSFRRGGLGSKALMSFTVRNANAFAVKNLEISCAFRSPDGNYATERRRVLRETVATRSRKAFPPTHIGFVNLKASRASCRFVTASRA
jgi:hypothetical protein